MLPYLILLGACASQTKVPEPSQEADVIIDNDADGYDSTEDCDDFDSAVFPGSTEICDGLDNNCDGDVDEGVTIDIYLDADEDGYGDDFAVTQACAVLEGYSLTGGDCDDRNGQVSPGSVEICDGVDNDCNGAIDGDDAGLDTTSATTYYQDEDADGFGNPLFSSPVQVRQKQQSPN